MTTQMHHINNVVQQTNTAAPRRWTRYPAVFNISAKHTPAFSRKCSIV